MRPSELAMQLSAMHNQIEIETSATYKNLDDTFQTDTKDNETTAQVSDLHSAMCDYIIVSSLATKYSKMLLASKKTLDRSVESMNGSSEGIPGQSVLLGKSNEFQFHKKQNHDGTSTLVVDLITELARAGVDQDIVNKAMKAATKPRKGNTYYNVTLVED